MLSHGFCNWKDATHSFSNHERSLIHTRAVEVVITLLQTTRDVGELLSTARAAEKCRNRKCLSTIAENISFLARQGISLRGDGKEDDINFHQLLHLRAIDQPHLLTWLERKSDKHTSPQVQIELLTVMGCTVLRGISAAIQADRYYSIMPDKVSDSSDKEQVIVCFRRVDYQFEAHEEFIGLYQVGSID